MRLKKGLVRQFFKKMRFKYRVSIINENTLEQAWSARLSRMTVFLFLFTFAAVTFILLTVLILATPVRYYLPGYGDTVDRSSVVKVSAKVDSLINQLERQATYIEVVKGAIKGDIQPDSIPPVDSIQHIERTVEFLEKTASEKRFIDNYGKDRTVKPE
ncbi:MAG: hypothetical protein LBS01_04250 [Prevotellaceae bacterium]|jgi:hypothetical protein|nr:hypothetical protein [Prevotellaceae bacterium]